MIVLAVVWFIFKFFFLIVTGAFVLTRLSQSEEVSKEKYFAKRENYRESELPRTSQENVIYFIAILILLIIFLEFIELCVDYLWDFFWFAIL